jgi:hypothetical protein
MWRGGDSDGEDVAQLAFTASAHRKEEEIVESRIP